MKEWREVTLMKEWVKPLYIGYHQALELPKTLFPFPRTGHLKISLGPTQCLYSQFHGLLKLIFHTNYLGTKENWTDIWSPTLGISHTNVAIVANHLGEKTIWRITCAPTPERSHTNLSNVKNHLLSPVIWGGTCFSQGQEEEQLRIRKHQNDGILWLSDKTSFIVVWQWYFVACRNISIYVQ